MPHVKMLFLSMLGKFGACVYKIWAHYEQFLQVFGKVLNY